MKKRILVLAAAVVLSLGTSVSTSAAGCAGCPYVYVDANNDSICDNFVDEDGDGINDNCAGKNYNGKEIGRRVGQRSGRGNRQNSGRGRGNRLNCGIGRGNGQGCGMGRCGK